MTAALVLAVQICLQPLDPVDPAMVRVAARGIEHVYGFAVSVLPSRSLPREAWYAPRKRYRAEKLLDFMDEDIPKGCDAMMGLTRVDISTTKGDVTDWGVLGLAHLGGPSGVVSSFRMKTKDRATLLRRAVKTVNHELGHVIGLDHDDSVAGCVMNDAKGTVRTVDRETGVLCDHERAAIEAKWAVKLPLREQIDWASVTGAP